MRGPRRSSRRPAVDTLRSGVPVRRARQAARGVLVLVVGPSGAGKDTLIAGARRKFAGNPVVVFPRRTITRDPGPGEEHVAVSRADFKRQQAAGSFLLSWQAHGLSYGLPAEVARDLAAGRTVVANVSRTIVAQARELWPVVRVVHVEVDIDVLRTRLIARGRETAADIDKRIARAARTMSLPEEITDRIDNSGRLATAARRFNALIAGYAENNAGSLKAKR